MLQDLNRQVVVSEHATVSICDIELEVPAGHERGYLNTVEGILRSIRSDLHAAQQEQRVLSLLGNTHRPLTRSTLDFGQRRKDKVGRGPLQAG